MVRDACQDRGYTWIFPSNPERVLAGPKGKRPKVRSLLQNWSKWSRQTIRLVPCQGQYAVYRRLSAHRIGSKTKSQTYYVHQEKRRVHSLGEVRLVISTKKKDLRTATHDDVKILLTNGTRAGSVVRGAGQRDFRYAIKSSNSSSLRLPWPVT